MSTDMIVACDCDKTEAPAQFDDGVGVGVETIPVVCAWVGDGVGAAPVVCAGVGDGVGDGVGAAAVVCA